MPSGSDEYKRICFISSRAGNIKDENTFCIDWANGRLITELAKVYNTFSVAIFSVKTSQSNFDYQISCSTVYALPVPFSQIGGLRNVFAIYRMFRKIELENDILIVQLPFIGFMALPFLSKPTVFHLCANVLTASANPFKYKGMIRIFSRGYAFAMHTFFRRLFSRKNTRLIVNGDELKSIYGSYHPEAVVSSSVNRKEIIKAAEIAKRSPHEPFRLLFIGRPSKEKGFPTLIEAFKILRDRNIAVELNLMGLKREDLDSFIDSPVSPGHLEHIHFHGFVSWGEKFKSIVQSSHALVMCSVSEGTPRVIIESRALGCPVIATRIGGIVSSVTDSIDGLLIPVADSNAIVKAVLQLMDEPFRIQLAVNGLKTVEKYTVEQFASKFVEKIEELTKA
jgi:glycosyltransferase involved in cell wall biosynthesis